MNHTANRGHIGTEPAGFLDIHVNLPIDSGQGQGVLYIRKPGRGREAFRGNRDGGQKVLPIVTLQPQMHRLARRRPTRQRQDFGLDARDFRQPGAHIFHDDIAIQIGTVLACFPWRHLDLQLTDCIARTTCAACVLVQTTRTGKAEHAFNAFCAQNHILSLLHQGILFGDRKVAARADVNNCLLGLAFDEELHTTAVLAEIGEDAHHKHHDGCDCDEWHDGIAGQPFDEPTKQGAPMPGIDAARAPFDLCGTKGDRAENSARHKQDRAQQKALRGSCVRPQQIARVQRLHGRHEQQIKRRWHQKRTHHPRQHFKRVRGILEHPAGAARNAPHDRQIYQRHNQRCGQNENQRDRQHAHELPRHTGPEQHRQERTKRRRGRTDNGPEHPLGRLDIGMHRPRAVLDAAVGIFDNHDRTINQHTHRKDQAKHHNV